MHLSLYSAYHIEIIVFKVALDLRDSIIITIELCRAHIYPMRSVAERTNILLSRLRPCMTPVMCKVILSLAWKSRSLESANDEQSGLGEIHTNRVWNAIRNLIPP